MVSCYWGFGGTELGEGEGWDAGGQTELLSERGGAEVLMCRVLTISEGLRVAFYVKGV